MKWQEDTELVVYVSSRHHTDTGSSSSKTISSKLDIVTCIPIIESVAQSLNLLVLHYMFQIRMICNQYCITYWSTNLWIVQNHDIIHVSISTYQSFVEVASSQDCIN